MTQPNLINSIFLYDKGQLYETQILDISVHLVQRIYNSRQISRVSRFTKQSHLIWNVESCILILLLLLLLVLLPL